MKFGNWKFNNDQIEYSGASMKRFVVPVSSLLETIELPGSDGAMYKWIMLATEDDTVTVDDLYDLNYAFVYAAGRGGLELDYSTFDRSVEYQFMLLDEEEDEDDGLVGLSEDDADAEQKRKDAFSERD